MNQSMSLEKWGSCPPHLYWIKNDHKFDREFQDGQTFLIAVPVQNNKTGALKWDIDKISMLCDGESATMWYAHSDIPYDAWLWSDVEYFIEVKE